MGVELANTGVPHAYASVNSRSCSSVKSFLKTIIAQITALNDDPLDTEAIATAQKDTKLLNYDPQILSRWCQARNTRQVVIVFEDTEAFNSTLLGDIIDLFK